MILLGNTYPLNLVRRPVRIEPASLDELRQLAKDQGFLSFWGHDNTRAAVTQVLGFDPAPKAHRPSLTLSAENLPTLDDTTFDQVWILSPDYVPGFRPPLGSEVHPDKIISWQVLHLTFE